MLGERLLIVPDYTTTGSGMTYSNPNFLPEISDAIMDDFEIAKTIHQPEKYLLLWKGFLGSQVTSSVPELAVEKMALNLKQEHFIYHLSASFPEGVRGRLGEFHSLLGRLFSLQEGEPITEEGEAEIHSLTIENFSTEATRRLSGYERVIQELFSISKKEAYARNIPILIVDVRPAWSHEYKENSGVVVDIEIKGSAEERFSLWDAICERIDQLKDSLSQEEWQFLTDEISFIVRRS